MMANAVAAPASPQRRPLIPAYIVNATSTMNPAIATGPHATPTCRYSLKRYSGAPATIPSPEAMPSWVMKYLS